MPQAGPHRGKGATVQRWSLTSTASSGQGPRVVGQLLSVRRSGDPPGIRPPLHHHPASHMYNHEKNNQKRKRQRKEWPIPTVYTPTHLYALDDDELARLRGGGGGRATGGAALWQCGWAARPTVGPLARLARAERGGKTFARERDRPTQTRVGGSSNEEARRQCRGDIGQDERNWPRKQVQDRDTPRLAAFLSPPHSPEAW